MLLATPLKSAARDEAKAIEVSWFDIPAQPLERALIRYSSDTGIQILYDAGLVEGKRSGAVEGRFSPQQALERLLEQTGLRVRYTTPGAITLTPMSKAPPDVLELDTLWVEAQTPRLMDSRRFHTYGEELKSDILTALHRDPVAGRGRYEITLRVWVDSQGAVVRSKLAVSTGSPEQDSAILQAVSGVSLNRPPPEDMPQPVSFRFRAQPID